MRVTSRGRAIPRKWTSATKSFGQGYRISKDNARTGQRSDATGRQQERSFSICSNPYHYMTAIV